MSSRACSFVAKEVMTMAPAKRRELFRSLPVKEQVSVLWCVSRSVRFDLLKSMPEVEVVQLLGHLDPDELTDLLASFPKKTRQKLLAQLQEDLQEGVAFLSTFDARTAAGLMHLDYVQVLETALVQEVAERVRSHEARTGRTPIVLAMRGGQVRGEIPLSAIGLSKPSEPVTGLIRHLFSLPGSASLTELLEVLRRRHTHKVLICGKHDEVMGVVYADDVLRVVGEQASGSLYTFAGVSDEETVHDSARRKVHARAKWLLINLATAFLASAVVGLFEGTLSREVLLAVFMPIVAGMGGNAATQTLAVLVRGLSLSEITLKTCWPTVRREVAAGFVNGVMNGLVIFAVVGLWQHRVDVGLILGSAMVVNLMVAAFFGTLVPVLMKHLGKDPAASATVFITTATDVFGFLVFLGLASLIL